MQLPTLSLLVRRLAMRPGYTAAAVLTLALGLGANLTIFSLVRGVLLRPLPYPREHEVVEVFTLSGGDRSTSSPPDFADFRARARSLAGLAAFTTEDSLTLTGATTAEQVPVSFTTDDFFAVMGMRPAIGRTFTATELHPGNGRALILSDRLWRRRFGADPAIVGRTVRADGAPWTVVGVMPPSFDFPAGRQAWAPLAFDAQTLATQRGAHYLRMVGRLRPGAALESAQAELRGIAAVLAHQYPNSNERGSAEVVPLRESIVGRVKPQLLVLQWAVALVLLIATANVASLLLARVLERRREVALRIALGASRASLVGDVLGESLLLAGVAAALALALSWWLVSTVRGFTSLPLPRLREVHLDGLVVAIAVVAALGTAVAMAVVASLRVAANADLGGALGGSRTTIDRGGLRLRGALIVTESALAVVLLFGAALLGRSFTRLSHVDPGFDVGHSLSFTLGLPSARYPTPADRRRVTAELLARLEALPGVQAVGAATALPFSPFTEGYSVEKVDGNPPASAGSEMQPSVVTQVVTPGFLRALRVPLLRGRGFDAGDRADGPLVCLIDVRAAQKLWPGGDPIGHTLEIGTRFGQGGTRRGGGVVIGVVGAVRQEDMAAEPAPTLYVLHDQFPIPSYGVVVRTSRPARSLEREVRAALRVIDPDLAAADVRPLASYVEQSLAEARLRMLMLALFGGVALLLAAVGLYGVMAFAALQAKREMAIRMALGSAPASLLRRLLARGLLLGGAGLAIGLAAALPLGNLLRRWLYDLAPQDPWSATVAVVLLLAVCALASLGPAWRATRVDLSSALRE